jgi:F5/8 type C domain-containing protein/dolichyl-phosphate-mannose-protein mannosyltransferase
MPQAFYILFGASFAVASALALGKLLLRGLGLKFYRAEEHVFAFATGAACLSFLVFLLTAAQLARKGIFLALGLVIIVLALRSGAHPSLGEEFPPLPRFWKILFGVIFAFFTVVYFANAMAPEMSPDGSSYHLGLVARYVRERGFPRITTNMYANLSQGVEMLFLYAFAFGRHSAAALVHFSFLVALPLAMLAYAKRFGFPRAGAAAALLFYMSPVVGIDGISAYIDVATACVLFAVFYLLQIWDSERNPALLVPIGILAGFGYAAKYTAFVAVPYAVLFVGWKLVRAQRPWLKPVIVVTACALLMVVPWIAKNWIVLGNPFSPFFNGLFPNPYVHVSFEKEYAAAMRNYPGLKSRWDIPLEVTVRGNVLGGLLGPVFLLAPIGFLALRETQGRQLLLAAAVFGSTYFANIGTRFLIPPLPYIALLMAMAMARWREVAPVLVVAHVLASWPPNIKKYSDDRAWRLVRVPWKPALRIEPEDSYLNFRSPGYVVARYIEAAVPEGEKVLALSPIFEAYTKREILIGYQSAFNQNLTDILWTPVVWGSQPTWRLTFRFPAVPLRKIRVVQTATAEADIWSISELRLLLGDQEIPRSNHWWIEAHPNPWDAPMAIDGNPITRWRSWQALEPGMFVELDFGQAETVDSVRLECSQDQQKTRLKLEGQLASGEWKKLDGEPQSETVTAPPDLRRASIEELRRREIKYLLLQDDDFKAEEFRTNYAAWGITPLGERAGARLYRLD